MCELINFHGKTQHFNILSRIGIAYIFVGTALLKDDNGDVVPAIMSEHRGNVELINMDILSRWMQGKGIADCTWRGLLGVLRIHCPGLARDIEETLRVEIGTSDVFLEPDNKPVIGYSGEFTSAAEDKSTMSQSASREEAENIAANSSGASSTTTIPHSTLSCFSEELRHFYAEHPLPYYFNPQCYKWMPNVSKKYIHPDIISKEEQEKQPDAYKEAVLLGEQWRITEKGGDRQVQLAELLEARSAGTKCECILIEGGPGMGKTTLVWQVCHCWGRRELFGQYSTVLLLPLRDSEVQQAKEVEDLLFHLMRDKKTRKLNVGNGRNILVILDGLDELPGSLLSKQSVFTDLLSGKVLSEATILVTSRPSATHQLRTYWTQRISKHYVICGFTKKNIEEYTESVLSGEKLTEFHKQLSIHPHIQSIMYVPLHSVITMAVYLQCKHLPKTVTELYTWFVRIILSQFITDHSNYSEEEKIHILGLKLPITLHGYFRQLSNFAFENVCNQKIIFSDMPKEIHDLGFTDSVPELFLPGSCSYNFLHLSIQEFLAAYHVSLLSPLEQEQLLLRSRKEHHFQNMMRYVAGLTKFEGIRREAVKHVIELKLKEKTVCRLDGYSLELLYECQNVILDKDEICRQWQFSLQQRTHQYLALGYCIANSKCTWELELKYLSNTQVQLLIQGLQDSKIPPAYTIKWIIFSSDEVCTRLLTQTSAYFTTHLDSLTLLSGIDSFTINFSQWLSICQLKMLSLLRLQPETIEIVSRALNAAPSLKTLDMRWSKFTPESMQTFASMLQQNQSLTEVTISESSIGRDCASFLAMALHTNTTLAVLDLSNNPIREEGAMAMAVMLKYNIALTNLNMTLNSIGDKGALTIAEMMKYNTTLRVLDLRKNSIGKVGATAMAGMLRCSSSTLTKLNMSSNKLYDEGAVAIDEMFKQNTKLIVLNIGLNSIGDMGALAMAGMLKCNTTLREMDISGNSICEWGAIAVAEMLKLNTTLTNLHMSQNSVGTEGARAMAVMLESNATLTVLNISENMVGIEGALAIAEMLKYNATLTVLDISENTIGAMGAGAISEALKHNTTLTELNISGNFVGIEGALVLAEMLKFNTTLERLYMIDFTIGDEGAKTLVESLKMNYHLKELKVCLSNEYKKVMEDLPTYHANKERVICKSVMRKL